MIRSMTAYSRSEYQQGDSLFMAEIRSLNHRYLDISLRIPRNLQILEKELRGIISSKARRGRIEVSIQMKNGDEESDYELELNVPLVKSYFKIFKQLAEQFGIDREIQPESLWQMKDVILARPPDMDAEEIKPGLQTVLTQALDLLQDMKLKEGEAIEADFLKRIKLVEQYVSEIEKRTPNLIVEYRKKLNDNIQRMLKDVSVDESRIAQEVAFFAEKSDITEEIVRIKSHLKQFREYLVMDDALGRRLDFLIQEINREVNTIGSKVSDSSSSQIVVEMKAELEKLREQVQNVE